MATRVFEGLAGAKYSEGVEGLRIESVGPVTVVATCQGPAGAVIGCSRADGTFLATDKDTGVTGEDTTYDGDGSTLEFSGAALAQTPVVPGSLVLSDAGAVAPDLVDKGDGKLYTADEDEESGTVDYLTGDLVLAYPAGKAPGTGVDAIEAAYSYQDELLVAGGRRNFSLANVGADETVVVKAAADAIEGCLVKLEGIATWL